MANQSDVDKAKEQAQKARDEANAALNEVEDLKKDMGNNAVAGDPKKASTTQLITGDY